jgi:(p)ppGpp synthase/HD superfamily hydrolase
MSWMSCWHWRRDIRNQMVNFLQAQFNKPSAEEQDAAALKQLQQKTCAAESQQRQWRVVVEGVGNLHHIARCCQPIPATRSSVLSPGARDFRSPGGLRSAG